MVTVALLYCIIASATLVQCNPFLASHNNGVIADVSDAPLPRVSKRMMEVYRNIVKTKELDGNANTVHILDSVATSPAECGEYNFNLSTIKRDESTHKSELHLYMLETKGGASGIYHVEVKMYRDLGRNESHVIASRQIRALETAGWKEFQLEQDLVQDWIRQGNTHAFFKIFIYGSGSNSESDISTDDIIDCGISPIRFIDTHNQEDNSPRLLIYSFSPKLVKIDYHSLLSKTRHVLKTKRQLSVTRPYEDHLLIGRSGELTCHLESFPINFEEDLGFDFIVAPSYYDARICSGLCPELDASSFHYENSYMRLLWLLRYTRPSFGEVATCCVPVEYGSLEVLLLLESGNGGHTLKIEELHNSKVRKCRCTEVVITK